MKIAFFTNYSHEVGTYFRWHNLALGLINAGHQVDIYAGDHDYNASIRKERRDGIDYYIVPCLISTRLLYKPNDIFSAIRRLFHLPEQQYQVYHLFQPFLQAYIPWKNLRSKNKKAVFIYDWDDLWTNGLFVKTNSIRQKYIQKVTALLERRIPEVSDGVTVCSEFLNNRLPKDTLSKNISNGFWPKAVPQKSLMRSKWHLKEDTFYIAYIGKTAGELDWIIDALTVMRKIRSDVRLLIAGPPKTQIDEFPIEKRSGIDYMGSLTPNEAREIATAADLGLIPLDNSLFNQSRFPIKFFDFLTVNTPVYLSDVGEIALIGKKMEQIVVGPNQKDAWVKGMPAAIDFIMNRQLPKVPLEIIHQYSWDTLALQLADFYRQIIAAKIKTDK